MILDNEKQREILLAAIKATSWPGQIVKEAAAVMMRVERAEVAVRPESAQS